MKSLLSNIPRLLAALAIMVDTLPGAACDPVFAPGGITVLTPSSSGFADATERWNGYKGPTFKLAAIPNSAAQVATVVKAAAAAKVPFLAQGGRHGYGTTYDDLNNGLSIDLSRLNSVKVDAAKGTVTIGGSATVSEVINAVAAAGYQIGSGACNCVGYTGTALGAGIGYLQGTFGLVIDSLVSADFVTAKGEQIKVSATSNSDLFWGLRGAGANFGVVTASTYKISKPVNGGVVYHAELIFTSSQQAAYFKAMEAYKPKMTSNMGFSTALFWDAAAASTTIMSTFIYVGTEAAARAEMKPFFDLVPIVAVSENIPFQQVPSVVLSGVTDGSCGTTNGLHSIHTVNVKNWPAVTFSYVFTQFDAFLKANEQARTANSAIIIETFSTAAATAVPDSSAAYPWRDSAGYIMLQMRWPGQTNSFGTTANAFAKGLVEKIAATSGYSGVSAYVNYAWGDETLEQIYRKDKLPTLAALKKKWDPSDLFGYSNGLPTKYP